MKKKTTVIIGLVCFVCSAAFCLYAAGYDLQQAGGISPVKVGEFCVSQVYPAAKWEKADEKNMTAGTDDKKQDKDSKKTDEKEKPEVDNSKPQVIIYHTHSSESYQPYSESNFHRADEVGTVREVGDVMLAELNEMGIAAIHDKTIHDRPSYNQSYDRSMETISALMRQYPEAEVIIDLHRDAAAYTGNKGETVEINGETVAKYKLVIGQGNDNYSNLMSFARSVNDQAEALYPGFGGRIIEKSYRFNEYISDHYLLLEVGNNQNDIESSKATGKYFAHVLAEMLKGE